VAADPIPRDGKSLGLLHTSSHGWHRGVLEKSALNRDVAGLVKAAPPDWPEADQSGRSLRREVVVAFNSYASDAVHSGMHQRMRQVVETLAGELGFTVHMVALVPQLRAPYADMFTPALDVRFYYGDMLGQVSCSPGLGLCWSKRGSVAFGLVHVRVVVARAVVGEAWRVGALLLW
jgi:hypothetical protein